MAEQKKGTPWGCWGYVDGTFGFISKESEYVTKDGLQNAVNDAVKDIDIDAEFTQEGNDLSLSVNGKEAGKVTIDDIYLSDVELEEENHLIKFTLSNGDVKTIDTTSFVKDGMVESVVVENGILKITFNTDAENKTIELPIKDLFDADNYYTKTDIDGKGFITEHQDISNLATKEEVNSVKSELTQKVEEKLDKTEYESEKTTFETKENASQTYQPKGDYALKTEIPSLDDYATEDYVNGKITEVEGKIPSIDGLATKDELQQTHANVEDLSGEVATLEADKADKTYVDDKFQEKGDYPVYERYDNEEQHIHKKTIALENNDNISGKMTDGLGVNIAMVSKWDVADFGSVKLPINLNGSKERPTYNDNKEIALLNDVESLKLLIEELKTYSGYDKGKENAEVIEKGGDVYLLENFKAPTAINIEKNTLIDLLDYEMSAVGDEKGNTVVISGADVTLRNGKIKAADTAHIDYDTNTGSSTILIDESDKASHVILENLDVVGGVYPVYLKNNVEGTSVTIKSGTYYSNYLNNPAVYVQNGGKVIVEGGTFGKDGRTYPYLLNIKDSIRTGKDVREFIEVKGGTFINFDPSNNKAEGANTNFVADGYEVETHKVGSNIYYYVVKSNALVVSEIKKGGNITLEKNVYVEDNKELTLIKNTNINLGGNEMTFKGGTYGDSIVIGNGANVTISNGELKPAENASADNASATILIKTASASHLTLNDVKVTGIHPIYLNSANEDSSVTINGGEFYTTMPLEGVSSDKMAPAVYVGKGGTTAQPSTIGGKVTINGGTFGSKGVVNNFLLNVEDVLRKQEGKEPRNFIEVFGGKYWNFDPSNNKAEGEGTSFVADGYKVIETKNGDDTIYEVVKDEE